MRFGSKNPRHRHLDEDPSRDNETVLPPYLDVDGGCTRMGRPELQLGEMQLGDVFPSTGSGPPCTDTKGILDGSDLVKLVHTDSAAQLPCTDFARHLLISIRLQKAYFVYCALCFVLSLVVCISTYKRLLQLKRQGFDMKSHEWLPWETIIESGIGLAVCVETFSTLWLIGRRAFFRDCWCILDGTVSALTVLSWLLLILQRVFLLEIEIDGSLLGFRFLLQPCRVLAAVSMLRRVRQMQQNTIDIAFDVIDGAGSIPNTPSQSNILTPRIQADICEHLPVWCRYREWRLAYSPDLHGTSMQTFLRNQPGGGANVIIIRDSEGNVFGGFVSEEWRVCTRGHYGSPECFVFVARPQFESMDDGDLSHAMFYHYTGSGDVLLWCDGSELSLGGALHLRDDFRRGSSMKSPAFNSPVLTTPDDSALHDCEKQDSYHADFVVRHFECWQFQSALE